MIRHSNRDNTTQPATFTITTTALPFIHVPGATHTPGEICEPISRRGNRERTVCTQPVIRHHPGERPFMRKTAAVPRLPASQAFQLHLNPTDAGMQCCVAEPRYTIEQIALLQRLRLSGMSKPQILHALDSLERLDQEQSHTLPRQPPQCCRNHGNTPATPPTSSSSSLLAPSPSLSPSNEASPPPQGQSFSYDLEEWDVEERVEEYMRRDSSVVKEEIKVFLNNRRISQAIVGQVTGISQSYISQWLLQQGLEMSDPKKRAFYRWYLLERSSPGTTLSLRPLCGPVKEEPEWSGSLGGGVSLRLRRGSRFTWRKECLSVMESFFQENQYPEESKREEIAGACNAVIQKPAGSRLSEFEKVTALKVYNWFANRRKEMKRRANIEAAILESHGIEVHSPSCQSNSDDIEGAELHDTADLTSGNAPQQEPLSLAEQAVTLHSPVLRLANQKAGELKREAVEEE
ncbi:homeobox-containing protein 1-like isoform X1 [Acipenser ruthenus]|uniref:homeobox-containing protein 1-like isoform X1 n=2 Tax=Acipenser ruthenus TaxID=7906 RepID=UPI002740C202|nr:homeobox-containing protein 1-like isoform X1 [Acipenser ruthenus]